MKYPIIKAHTKGDIELHGIFLEAQKSKSIVINIHGTASSFYDEDFTGPLGESLNRVGVSFLSTNNRGSNVLNAYPLSGAAEEIFEDCLDDIDAWIHLTLSRGYENIILQGHSLGTEKIVYYMVKGKYRNKVKALILLAFSDSYGSQMHYLKGKTDLLKEAKNLINNNKGDMFLASDWLSQCGVMPKSAKSYISFYGENSELLKALPFHKRKLESIRKIRVPILAVIGDQKEYTVVPVEEAIKLLKKENKLVEAHKIKNCNHDFEGKEKELAGIICNFIAQQF